MSYGTVYIIRNPLDVAVSASVHNGCTIEQSVKNLNNNKFALADKKNSLPDQLRQVLLSWSGHVLSWMNSPIPICFLRYEDMKLDSFNTFKKAVGFMELNKPDDEIRKAIDKSSFDNLQKQEKEKGFKEKSRKAEAFFRKGEIGDWRNHLNNTQVNSIIDHHKDVMEKFGYIKNGKSVF